MEDYRAQSKSGMGLNEYEEFKLNSVINESQDNVSLMPDNSNKTMNQADREINSKVPGESNKKVNFLDEKSQAEFTLKG